MESVITHCYLLLDSRRRWMCCTLTLAKGWHWIHLPSRDRRLSWHQDHLLLIVYQNGLPICRQSPVNVLTAWPTSSVIMLLGRCDTSATSAVYMPVVCVCVLLALRARVCYVKCLAVPRILTSSTSAIAATTTRRWSVHWDCLYLLHLVMLLLIFTFFWKLNSSKLITDQQLNMPCSLLLAATHLMISWDLACLRDLPFHHVEWQHISKINGALAFFNCILCSAVELFDLKLHLHHFLDCICCMFVK